MLRSASVHVNAVAIIPFPDESLYGVVCRANRLEGRLVPRQSSRKIFGFEISSLFDPIPRGTSVRVSTFGLPENNDILPLVEKTTFANLYSAWVPRVAECSLDGSAMSDLSRIINTKLKGLKPCPRQYVFCQRCVEEDLAATGVPYWRLSHQFPGVTVCHRHRCRLMRHRYIGPPASCVPTLQMPNEAPSDGRYCIEPICKWALFHDTRWITENLSEFAYRIARLSTLITSRLFDFLVFSLYARASRTCRHRGPYSSRIGVYVDALHALGIDTQANPVDKLLLHGHHDVRELNRNRADLCVAFFLALPFLFGDYEFFESEYTDFVRVSSFQTPINIQNDF